MRKVQPDKRQRWNDPNLKMRVTIAHVENGLVKRTTVDMTADEMRENSQKCIDYLNNNPVLAKRIQPDWRDDPTYDLKRRKKDGSAKPPQNFFGSVAGGNEWAIKMARDALRAKTDKR